MGFFDFVKSAGKKLGFGDDDAKNAEILKAELDSHDLGTDAVTIEVKGDTAIIKGAVADQAAFEKAIIAVGNTLGISKVESTELKVALPDSGLKLDKGMDMNALIAAATPPAEPKFHTVEKGDTLWAVAEKAYGKGKGGKYELIFEANKPMLSHPDKIYPGQVLRIPDIATA